MRSLKYFLLNCKLSLAPQLKLDKSEMTACSNILCDIISLVPIAVIHQPTPCLEEKTCSDLLWAPWGLEQAWNVNRSIGRGLLHLMTTRLYYTLLWHISTCSIVVSLHGCGYWGFFFWNSSFIFIVSISVWIAIWIIKTTRTEWAVPSVQQCWLLPSVMLRWLCFVLLSCWWLTYTSLPH